VFSTTGYDASTIKDIAAQSGLSAASVYYYFQFKHELFAEVYRDYQNWLLTEFRAAIDGSETLIGRLNALLDAVASTQAQDPSLADFVSVAPAEIRRHREIRDAVRDESRTIYRIVEEVVNDGRDELRPGVDASVVINVVVAIVSGLGQLAAGSTTKAHFQEATDGMKQLLNDKLFLRGPSTPTPNNGSADPHTQ
jgi:AcrR family transcriptional regulator